MSERYNFALVGFEMDSDCCSLSQNFGYFQININSMPYELDFLYHPILQDVVEIMRESLYDKYIDEHGVVDFGRSGGMSQQKEAKRFLSALNKQSELQQKDTFTISVCRSEFLCTFKTIQLLQSPIYAVLHYFRKYTVWLIGLA